MTTQQRFSTGLLVHQDNVSLIVVVCLMVQKEVAGVSSQPDTRVVSTADKLGVDPWWLSPAVFSENGKRIPAKQGTPQGAPIFILLLWTNIYLYYVMVLWGRTHAAIHRK